MCTKENPERHNEQKERQWAVRNAKIERNEKQKSERQARQNDELRKLMANVKGREDSVEDNEMEDIVFRGEQMETVGVNGANSIWRRNGSEYRNAK